MSRPQPLGAGGTARAGGERTAAQGRRCRRRSSGQRRAGRSSGIAARAPQPGPLELSRASEAARALHGGDPWRGASCRAGVTATEHARSRGLPRTHGRRAGGGGIRGLSRVGTVIECLVG